MFRVGIARVSTKAQQCSGNSLTEQVQRLKQYDATMPIYEFAQSAYNKSIFPHIKKILKPNIEIVVLYCDRLSRKIDHCTEFITKELTPINGHIYSISENIRTNTKTGLLEFYKKIMDGETLSHNLGLRVKDGLKHRKKKITPKYGATKYEKKNIDIIMELYNNKTKIKNILNYLKANNIKRIENENNISWNNNKINIIIKENKAKKEYKNNFLFNDFKKELESIQIKKRRNNSLASLNPKNKKNKTINDNNNNNNNDNNNNNNNIDNDNNNNNNNNNIDNDNNNNNNNNNIDNDNDVNSEPECECFINCSSDTDEMELD